MFVAGRQLRTLPYDCYDNNSNPHMHVTYEILCGTDIGLVRKRHSGAMLR